MLNSLEMKLIEKARSEVTTAISNLSKKPNYYTFNVPDWVKMDFSRFSELLQYVQADLMDDQDILYARVGNYRYKDSVEIHNNYDKLASMINYEESKTLQHLWYFLRCSNEAYSRHEGSGETPLYFYHFNNSANLIGVERARNWIKEFMTGVKQDNDYSND